MQIVHFAHEHPLIFKELEEIRHCCNACGLHVLLSPCYTCTIHDCNFYLHQACAQLPAEFHHYFRGDERYGPFVKHALALLAKPRDEGCLCGECGKLCKNFTYYCSDCEFVLHPLCGFPLDIQIKHMSHPQHPMAVVCKEALLLCDVCGRRHEGYFFSCHKCNFWVHQDCALLPSVIEVEKHDHHLSLIYSGASLDSYNTTNRCLICSKNTIRRFAVYFCFWCKVTIHVDCATSQMKDLGAILHLPTMAKDTFRSLIMHELVKRKAIPESNSTDMLEKYLSHSLVLVDDTAQESVCDACIQPVSPPYYRCSAHFNCNFILHKFCAGLPLSAADPIGKSAKSSLFSPRWDSLFSLFQCNVCDKYSNGFGYSFDKWFTAVDEPECVFAPLVIKHDSHKQHPLILTSPYFIKAPMSCCGKRSAAYHCGICNFIIHNHCARLPKTVTHKFDKHPLTLIFTSSSQHDIDNTFHDFCEFCEEDIDAKYWFYHCAECDQSFHVDCIPSLGKFSKIKFGGTVKVPCHDDHPLTLVRTLSVGSQTCGYCQDIIEGFKDGMALHWADCDFWIHFRCGYQSFGATYSHPYLPLSWLPT